MTRELDEIPELADLDAGGGLIRIPVEVNVPFTPRVRALVDTVEFQRLGQISQLGLVARVYPGARHTRFEHALGVFHNALCVLQQLRKDPRFQEMVDRHTAELLMVSALLHDLGHWPFCHPIEDLDLPLPSHESHAARFLTGSGSELAEVLDRNWQLDPADVLEILAGQTPDPRFRLLRSVLSGPIDVDKLDYLDRDSLHCGVPYGRHFDRQRLLQSLVLNESGDGIAITTKGKTAAELMIFARYVMFSEVYWHHAVRAATSMFARSFFELHQRLDLDWLLQSSEAEMVRALRQAACQTDCAPLVDGVFGPQRRLYKRMAEFSHLQGDSVYSMLAGRPYRDLVCVGEELAARVAARLACPVGRTDLLIDAPPPRREVEFEIDVLDTKRGTFRPLREISPVVDALARTQFDDYVKRVRVYGSPALAGMLRGGLELDELVAAACTAALG